MKANWRRWESRDVRPFFNVASAEHALADARLRLFEGRPESADTTVLVDELDLLKLEPVIYPNLAEVPEWLPELYQRADLALVVIASSSLLKSAVVVHRAPLDDEPASEMKVPRDVIDRLGGGRNLELSVAICLNEPSSAPVGVPFLEGHWLSKKTFNIKGPNSPDLFDIRTRTDEEWLALGFPAKTLVTVDYNGGINEEEDGAGGSVATVWLHKDAYDRMTVEGRPSGRILQPVLAVEIITQILELSFPEWKDVEAPAPKSPLASVLKRISSGKAMSIAEMKPLLDGPGRSRLRALLQDNLQAVRAVVEG